MEPQIDQNVVKEVDEPTSNSHPNTNGENKEVTSSAMSDQVEKKVKLDPRLEARMERRRKVRKNRLKAIESGNLGGKSILPPEQASITIQSAWRGR
jgi:hypothetical protein